MRYLTAVYLVLLVFTVVSVQGNSPIVSAAPPPPPGGWTDDGTVVRLNTISDSVGIGTASPAAKLSIMGDLTVSNGASIDNGLTVNSGTVNLPAGQIDNTELANSSINVNTDGSLILSGPNAPNTVLGDSVNLALNTANSNTWTAPQTFSGPATLPVTVNGKIYSEGIILKATDGPNCFLLSFNNSGIENHTPINCDGTPTPSSNTNSIALSKASQQFLQAPYSTTLDINGDLTVETWFYAVSNPIGGTLALVSNNGGSFSMGLNGIASPDTFRIYAAVNSPTVSTSFETGNIVISLNSWHHLAVVYNATAGSATLYLDGTLIQTLTGYPNSLPSRPSEFLCIGVQGGSCTTDWWDGNIDEVRIWNVARTQSQITEDSNQELTGSEPNLRGYWKFNINSGNTVFDSTVNGNNLTGINNPFPLSTNVPF